MARGPVTTEDRLRGRALGSALQQHRQPLSAAHVATQAGVSVDTLRKLERGAIPTPGFFVIAQLARTLGVNLDDLAQEAFTQGGKT